MERLPLSRERVLAAAMVLADGGGIESLTMRKLANALDVEAMSLYHHVANKDDILDGMLDVVAAEINLADAGDWKATTRHRAISAQATLLAHPWASMLWVSRSGLGPARMEYMDTALRTFRTGGLDEELVHHAYHVVENHIVGYSMQAVSFSFDMGNLGNLADEFLGTMPADVYPDLALHVAQHIEPPGESDETEFEFGLRLILDGIEQIYLAKPPES